MSFRLTADADLAELRRLFSEAGYEERALVAATGTAAPPTRAERTRFLHATRQDGALQLLARMFLAGMQVPRSRAVEVLPRGFVRACVACGLLEEIDGALMPATMVVPLKGLLFASDAAHRLGTDEAGEFVPPASTHAARHLLKLTNRRRVASMLDVGTGCGVQALFGAAHSDRVVATDITPRAVNYAQFNARLNGLQDIECLVGDRFEPVAGRQFDLIVSNPPFVPGPGRSYAYRDAGTELDGFCRSMVAQAPPMLNPGGMLQILCEWVEIEGEPWEERIRAWVKDSGCDCWVLRSPSLKPADYVAVRIGEISGPEQAARAAQSYAEWLDYFAEGRVVVIHPGVIVLRRRSGRNWFLAQGLERDVGEGAGDAIPGQFAAADFLARTDADEALLGCVLRPAPGLRLEQTQSWTEGAWRTDRVLARIDGALPLDAELDAATAVLLRQFDAATLTRDCLRSFARLVGEDPDSVTRATLPVVRFLVQRGLLLLPAPPDAHLPQL